MQSEAGLANNCLVNQYRRVAGCPPEPGRNSHFVAKRLASPLRLT